MADEIADILKNFALSSKEMQTTDLGNEELAPGMMECCNSLIGKIMGEKTAKYTGVRNFVNAAWSYPKDLKVVELGPNTFQFNIPQNDERERILNGGPWILDNQLLVLSKWYEGIEDDGTAFNIAPLWIQIWNLPLHWISKDAGKKIGKVFHQVKDVIIPQTGGKEGRHIKIFAMVDISQPLLRGTAVKVGNATKWLNFKYERVPDFCYSCGRIGHCDKTCTAQSKIQEGMRDNQFGVWMRAGNGRNSPQRKQGTTNFNHQKRAGISQEGTWREKDRPISNVENMENASHNEKEFERFPVNLRNEESNGDKAQIIWLETNQSQTLHKLEHLQEKKGEQITGEEGGHSADKGRLEDEGCLSMGTRRMEKHLHSKGDGENPKAEPQIMEEDNPVEAGNFQGLSTNEYVRTEVESMQVDRVLEEKKKEALVKLERRIKRPLKSPESRRQPLKEINRNTPSPSTQYKRKAEVLDIETGNEDNTEQQGKRSKCAGEWQTQEGVSEGEGSNPIWTPSSK